MICMLKDITCAHKSTNGNITFMLNGNSYIILKTTAEDYVYRGMRSTHKVCERLPDPMMLEQDENGKFIPVK